MWKLPGQNNICDMAAAGISFLKNRVEESPGTTWCNPYYYETRSFITQKSNTLTGPKDLVGKKIALCAISLDPNTTQDLEDQFKKANLDINQVTIEYTTNEITLAQLASEGTVFAAGTGFTTNQYLTTIYTNLEVAWRHDLLLPSGETGSEPYSFSTRTKSKGLVEALNNFIKENAYDTNVIIPIPPPAPVPISPKFDQVVQGNVDIKKLSRKKYKITFSEIRKFLLYQVWLDSSQQLNENRKAFYQNVKLWIENYNLLNDSLKAFNKPLFTPTVVMEIGSKKYLFVLNKVKLNGKGHIVFKVSTKEIKSSDKKILNFPRGHHDGVRFDIDAVKDWQTCTVNGPNESYPRSTYCQECRNCYSGCSNYQTCSCDSYCNVCTKFPCS
jgi:hypothetical protein